MKFTIYILSIAFAAVLIQAFLSSCEYHSKKVSFSFKGRDPGMVPAGTSVMVQTDRHAAAGLFYLALPGVSMVLG